MSLVIYYILFMCSFVSYLPVLWYNDNVPYSVQPDSVRTTIGAAAEITASDLAQLSSVPATSGHAPFNITSRSYLKNGQ